MQLQAPSTALTVTPITIRPTMRSNASRPASSLLDWHSFPAQDHPPVPCLANLAKWALPKARRSCPTPLTLFREFRGISSRLDLAALVVQHAPLHVPANESRIPGKASRIGSVGRSKTLTKLRALPRANEVDLRFPAWYILVSVILHAARTACCGSEGDLSRLTSSPSFPHLLPSSESRRIASSTRAKLHTPAEQISSAKLSYRHILRSRACQPAHHCLGPASYFVV